MSVQPSPSIDPATLRYRFRSDAFDNLWIGYRERFQSTFTKDFGECESYRSEIYDQLHPVEYHKHCGWHRKPGYVLHHKMVKGHFDATWGNWELDTKDKWRPSWPITHWFDPMKFDWYAGQAVEASDPEFWDWALTAFWEISQQIPQELSLPNFLIELRELGDLIPSIRKLRRTWNLVARGHLSVTLAWRPLIGDLTRMYNLLGVVKDRLEELDAARGVLQYLYAKRKLDHGVLPTTHVQSAGRAGWVEITMTERYSEFIMKGELYADLDTESIGAVTRATLAALGFGNPLLVAWDALPLSFVVDYVIHAGRALRRAVKTRPLEGLWKIYNVSTSRRDVVTWRVRHRYDGPNGLTYSQPEGFTQIVRYERFPGLPPKPANFYVADFSGLSTRELVTCLALLGSNSY